MRYALFSCYYYPSGGWDDLYATFDNLDEVAAYLPTMKSCEWLHVVCLRGGDIIFDAVKMRSNDSWKVVKNLTGITFTLPGTR